MAGRIQKTLIPAREFDDEAKLSHVIKMTKDDKGLPTKAIYLNYAGKPFQLQFGDPTDPEDLQPTVKISPRRHPDDVNLTEPTTLGYFVSIPHPDEQRAIRIINSYFQHNCKDWFDKPVPADRARDKVTDCFVEPAEEGQQFSIWAKVNQHPEKLELNTAYNFLVGNAETGFELVKGDKSVLGNGSHPSLIMDTNVQIRQGKAKAVFYTRVAAAPKREVVETTSFVFGGKKTTASMSGAATSAPAEETKEGEAAGGGGSGSGETEGEAAGGDDYDFSGAGLESSYRTAEPVAASDHVEVSLSPPAPAPASAAGGGGGGGGGGGASLESPAKRGRTKH